MLNKLTISNYILIDKAEIYFEPYLTVITGETGAGKSIILGAIGLLTGNRADSGMIRPGAERCVVEAEFTSVGPNVSSILKDNDIDVDDEICIVRREINSKGKSRSFVNDTPVSLSILKELGDYLVDIHSQHKNLLLGNTSFQTSILDLYASNNALQESYQKVYKTHRQISERLIVLQSKIREQQQEQEFIQYQLEKLNDANLVEGEDQTLQDEFDFLTHAQEIKEGYSRCINLLDQDEYGTISTLHQVIGALSSIVKFTSTAKDISDRLKSIKIDIEDIYRILSKEDDSVVYDPQRLEVVTERINLINDLMQRHKVSTVSELIDLRTQLQNKIDSIALSYDEIETLKKQKEEVYKELLLQAQKISNKRSNAAKEVEKLLIGHLKQLGMPHVRLKIEVKHLAEPTPNGMDKVEILFSANSNIAMEPVATIASGGEISRLMLCIKALIAGKRSLPTIIFDEIDTGVSGDIAEKIGEILQEMGRTMQVMAVTHLPQIAARGYLHLFVYKNQQKDDTRTSIEPLSKQKRIEEIARMQSGNNLTQIALAAAEELLTKALPHE